MRCFRRSLCCSFLLDVVLDSFAYFCLALSLFSSIVFSICVAILSVCLGLSVFLPLVRPFFLVVSLLRYCCRSFFRSWSSSYSISFFLFYRSAFHRNCRSFFLLFIALLVLEFLFVVRLFFSRFISCSTISCYFVRFLSFLSS